MNFVKLFTVILSLGLFIIACGESKPANSTATETNKNAPATTTPASTVDELASARSIYNSKCLRCHKADGSGGAVEIDGVKLNSEDFTSEKMKKMDDEKYVKYISKGIPDEGMPAFEKQLSAEEIKDVIKFIRAEFQK